MDDTPSPHNTDVSQEEVAAPTPGEMPESPCPYLPDRTARNEAYLADDMDAAMYETLMGRWFRRSGQVVYRPRCIGCAECRPLRVPVDRLRLSRSMRRVRSHNRDLTVDVGAPEASEEKFDIFRRYLDAQHDTTMERTFEAFAGFLYTSPVPSLEFCYRAGQRIIGVSIADCCPCGLSTVYMYFDPKEHRRSLGTYSALWEIDYVHRMGQPYYYLGYFVAGSKTMSYKARFRPNEVLVGDGQWEPFCD